MGGQENDAANILHPRQLVQTPEAALSLLQATFESTADGLLIVSREGVILGYNQTFLQMWNLPEELVSPHSDPSERFQYLANQTLDPEGFEARIRELFEQTPDTVVSDEIFLKDGRIFERYSQPQRLHNAIVGRVWSYRDITQRQQTAIALRQSENKFRRIVEQAHDVITLVDPDGNFIYASPNLSKVTGFTPDDVHGRPFTDFVHPEDLDLCAAVFQQVLATGQDLDEIELRTRHKAGHWIWQSTSLALSQRDNGDPLVLSVARVIEERKQREQALQLLVEGTASQTGEAFFNSCVGHISSLLKVDAVLIGEWEDDEQRRIQTRALLLDNQLQENIAYERQGTPCDQALQAGTAYYAEDLLSRFPGYGLFPGEPLDSYLGLPLMGASGHVIGLLAVLNRGHLELDPDREMFLNIFAARVAAELERQHAESALRQREAKYRTIFENSQVGIGRTSIQEGLILEANQRFADIMGYSSPRELIGQVSTLQFYVHPGDRLRILQQLQEEGIRDFELELRRRDGRRIWVLLSLQLNLIDACLEFVITDICERKQAEAALIESQQFFHTIVENLPLTIFSKNVRNNFRYELINSGCERILGFSREAGLGKNDHDLLPAERADMHRQEDLQVLALGHPLETSRALSEPNTGERIYIRSIKLPLFDPDGQPTHIVAFGEDVTDSKRQEEALRQSEERARTLIENVPGAVYRCLNDELLTMTFLSDGITALTGYAATDFIYNRALSFADLMVTEQFQRLRTTIQHAVNSHQPYEVEYPITHANGSERWLYEKGQGIFDDQGNLLRLYGVIIDITDRKRAEVLLASQKQVLEFIAADAPLEKTLTLLVNNFEELAQCTAGSILFLDETGERLHHGIAPSLPAVYQREIDGLPVGPNNGSCGAAAYRKAPVIVTDTFTDPLWQSWRHLAQAFNLHSCWSMPILSSHGMVVGTFALYFDRPQAPTANHWQILETAAHLAGIAIERKRTAEELFRAKDTAEIANQTKSKFLANMSHELRTPMNAILGFAQLIARDGNLASQHRQALAVINSSGKHLLDLINDVLEMSKIEAGTVTLSRQPFDLHSLLQTISTMFCVQAESKQLALHCTIGEGVPRYVVGDEGKLRQVMINLLGNAVKFTAGGHVAIQVRCLSAAPANGQSVLEFVVEDTGSGISEEILPILFQPFVQAFNHVPGEGGSGLGLAITQQFVQMMGGTVTVATAVDQGSTFTFAIPLDVADPAKIPIASAGKTVQRLAADQPDYRILVVDDRPENREPLQHLLQSVGFETRAATNGEDALCQWQNWHPHLIWMDMRMPSMDGYTATRRIRELEQTEPTFQRSDRPGGTKIIALTASAFEDQREGILAVGCDDFVHKPFHTDEIFRKISHHLGVRYELADVTTAPLLSGPKVNAVPPNALKVMPDGWLQAFKQAAIQADADWLASLIEQIPANQVALIPYLDHLVAQLDFETLTDLTETALGD